MQLDRAADLAQLAGDRDVAQFTLCPSVVRADAAWAVRANRW